MGKRIGCKALADDGRGPRSRAPARVAARRPSAASALRVPRADHRAELLAPSLDDPRLVFATFMEARRAIATVSASSWARAASEDEEAASQQLEGEQRRRRRQLERRKALVAAFTDRGIACASHDDTQTWHIDRGARASA